MSISSRSVRSRLRTGAVLACAAVLSGLALSSPALAGQLDAYLPKSGTIKGHVVELGVAKEDQAVSKQFQLAVQNNMDWFKHYVTANKAGEPLPYNPKMGVTQAQYTQLLHMKADFIQKAPIEITVKRGADGSVSFTSNDPAAANLQKTSFSADQKSAETPVGKLTIVTDIHQKDMNAPFGVWNGTEWARTMDEGSDQPAAKLAFGKRDPSGEGVMYFQVAPVKDKPEQSLVVLYGLD